MRLAGAIRAIRLASDGFVAFCFMFMVGAVLLQVLGRHVLPFHIASAAESATFAQIWLTAIGASLALRQGALFAVDTLPRRLGRKGGRILSIVIAALSLIFLAVMVYGGVVLTRHGFQQTSPTLLLPMWTIFISIPIGMSLLALEVVLKVVEEWDEPFRAAGASDSAEDIA